MTQFRKKANGTGMIQNEFGLEEIRDNINTLMFFMNDNPGRRWNSAVKSVAVNPASRKKTSIPRPMFKKPPKLCLNDEDEYMNKVDADLKLSTPKVLTLNEIHANFKALCSLGKSNPLKNNQKDDASRFRNVSRTKSKIETTTISREEEKYNVAKKAQARKAIDFVSRNKRIPISTARKPMTQINSVKQPTMIQIGRKGKNSLRISGVHMIPQTPVNNIGNKENIQHENINHSIFLQNEQEGQLTSSFVNSERSFLQQENKINMEEPCCLKASTPFKIYRNVRNEITNMTNDLSNSVNESNKEVDKLSVNGICEKSIYSNSNINSIKDVKNELSNSIAELKHFKQRLDIIISTHEKLLNFVGTIIDDKLLKNKNVTSQNESSIIVKKLTDFHIQYGDMSCSKSISQPNLNNKQDINPKHNTLKYTVPKKTSFLRKTLHKSMPHNLDKIESPITDKRGSRALSMYMEMKQNFQFLQTPQRKMLKKSTITTPRLTSLNVMNQLEKLYKR